MHIGKKENYLNTADAYKDMDGNMKQFTHIDHDVKTKISRNTTGESTRDAVNNYIKETKEEILSMPAVSVSEHETFHYLIIRDLTEKLIKWNKEAVNDISDFYTLYRLRMLTWKNTVKDIFWFDDMREDHEAIIRGDWKSLM